MAAPSSFLLVLPSEDDEIDLAAIDLLWFKIIGLVLTTNLLTSLLPNCNIIFALLLIYYNKLIINWKEEKKDNCDLLSDSSNVRRQTHHQSTYFNLYVWPRMYNGLCNP